MTQNLPPKFIFEACMALCFDGIPPDYLRQAKLNQGDENLVVLLENCLLEICGNKITKNGDLKCILKLFNYPIFYDKSPLNILKCICWVAIKLQIWRDYSAKKMLLNYPSFHIAVGPFLEIQSICQHFVDNNNLVDKKNHIDHNLTSNPCSFENNLDSIVAQYGTINHKLRIFKALDKRRVTLFENISALQKQQNLLTIMSKVPSPRLFFGLSTNIKCNNKSSNKSNKINYHNIDNLISNSNEFKIAIDNAKSSQLNEIAFWKWITEGVIQNQKDTTYHNNQLEPRLPPSRPQLSVSRLDRDRSNNYYHSTITVPSPVNLSHDHIDFDHLNVKFQPKNIQHNMKHNHRKASSLNTKMKDLKVNSCDTSTATNIATYITTTPFDESPLNLNSKYNSKDDDSNTPLSLTDVISPPIPTTPTPTPPTTPLAMNDDISMESTTKEDGEPAAAWEILKQEMSLSVDMISEVEEAVQTIYLSGGISRKLLNKIATVVDSELNSLGFDDSILDSCFHHASSRLPKEDDSLHYKLLQQYWITPITGVDRNLSELREKHTQLLNCALNACEPYSPYRAIPVRKSNIKR